MPRTARQLATLGAFAGRVLLAVPAHLVFASLVRMSAAFALAAAWLQLAAGAILIPPLVRRLPGGPTP